MKIAVRGGHTELCTGASALINELTEDSTIVAVICLVKMYRYK